MSERALLGPIIAGLAVGIVATVFIIDDGAAEEPSSVTSASSSSTTTTTTAAVWVDPEEGRIGSSVVVATALEEDRGDLVLSYDVIGLTPPDGHQGGGAVAAVPRSWSLATPDGPVTASVFGPSDRSIRFSTSAAITDVGPARIVSSWMTTPFQQTVTLGIDDASWHDIVPGVRVRLLQIVEQSDNFLVIVEASGDAPSFRQMTVEGVGRSWVSSSRSMVGSSRWTLDFRGAELPEPLELVVRGTTLMTVDTDVTVGIDRAKTS